VSLAFIGSTVRAVITTLFITGASIIGSLLALASRVFDRSGNTVVFLARQWSRAVLWVGGVNVKVEWRGKLEPDQPYVIMANHQSSVDIWALFVALPLCIRMIAKKQLSRIPLFGWAMSAGRFIFIDRVNAIAARRSIEEAKNRIRGGQTVVLFPEGTRSRDGKLGAFKKGGFHLAIDAGVPILPVALKGTRETMPRGSLLLRAGRVQAIVGTPIPTAGLSETDRHKLLEQVRGCIAEMLGETLGPVPERALAAGGSSKSPVRA
jgi:1-acyl-sn-glycerol-3-phosphate acyltransferase